MVDDVNQGPSVVDNRVLKNRLMAATRDLVGGVVGGCMEGQTPNPLPVLVLGPAGYALHCTNPLIAGTVPFLLHEIFQMGEYEESPE